MNMKLTTEDKIKRQVIQLTESHPFWAYLILKLKINEDTTGIIPKGCGAGVNARGEMFYKKEFIDMLTDDEIKFVLAHEVGHLVWGHLLRLGSRHRMKWNIATDCVLNDILQKNGFSMIKNKKYKPIVPKHDDTIKLGGKTIENVSTLTAEELYDLMPEIPQCKIGTKSKSGENGDSGEGGDGENGENGENPTNGYSDDGGNGFDDHDYSKGLSDAEKQELENQWKNNVTEAATHAKMKGKLPAGMEGLIGNILDPKLNWKQIILKYIKNTIPYDSSFSRPNKKFLANGIILPGTIKETVEIVCHLDVSGSISDEEMRGFLGEMKGVAQAHRNVKITIIQADCEINDVSDITTRSVSELTTFKRKGYGGTSHVPVFDYIKKNIRDCKLLISFTDGYSDMDQISKPQYDVIWGLTRNSTDNHIKWGKVVHVK